MLTENIVTWENNVEKCEICLFLSYKIKFSFALVELFLKVKISININKEGKKIRCFLYSRYFSDKFLYCDIICRQNGIVPNLLTSGWVEIGLEWHWWIKGIHKIRGARFHWRLGDDSSVCQSCICVLDALFCRATPLRGVLTVFNFSPLALRTAFLIFLD